MIDRGARRGRAMRKTAGELYEHMRSLSERQIPFQYTNEEYDKLLGPDVVAKVCYLMDELNELPIDRFTEVVIHGWLRLFVCFCEQCRPEGPVQGDAAWTQ